MRFTANRNRADHALLHAAAHLMGKLLDALLGRRQTHAAQDLHRPLGETAPSARTVPRDRLAQLVANGEHGIERGLRILQDHGDVAPADLAHFARALAQQIFAVE